MQITTKLAFTEEQLKTEKKEKKKKKKRAESIVRLTPPDQLTFNVGQQMLSPHGASNTVTAIMNIENPSSDTILFKVKTTAPRLYYVKPKLGVIAPMASIAVQVVMLEEAVKQGTSRDDHKHDKFLVKSILTTGDGDVDGGGVVLGARP